MVPVSASLIQIYQCFCDETRLRLLNILTHGPLCVCHFQEVLEETQVKISKHLGYLRDKGLVEVTRHQNWMIYSLPHQPSSELEANLGCLQDCVQSHPVFRSDLKRLGALHPKIGWLDEVCGCRRPPAHPDTFTHSPPTTVPMKKKTVLYVCIHNSARSQMAEAWLKHFCGDQIDVESAGLEPGTINPLAIEVMREVGIDIAKNKTQSVFDLFTAGRLFNYVITVCDGEAAERCPIFVGVTTRLHWSFPDPSAVTGTHEEKLEQVRLIRDQIRDQVEEWCGSICNTASAV